MPAAEQYANLDFDRFLEQLAGYAGSPLTRSLIETVEIEFHPSRIEENLDQTAEALRFMSDHASVILPFGQVEDITGLLELVYAGEMVDAQQVRMLIRFLQTCLAYDEIHHQLPMDVYPRLNDAASAWQPLSQLASLTRRLFNEEGEVRDSASPALSEIRSKLARFEGDVGRGVRDLLRSVREHTGEDPNLAIRGNRFVVLIPRGMVRDFSGSIVDMSGSGQNVYFEPAAIAPLNTERQHLFLEEDQEIRRILREYGMQLASHSEQIRADLAVLVKFDYIFARAKHANALRASRPRMNERGAISLRRAIHPLLYKDFVPEDLVFEAEKALIISGVNAGGKTVLLKLAGLYVLMAALGCYVPGDAELPYITALLADIGDDQSTLNNLSTFTAHLRFIDELWRELEPLREGARPVLVLIDEIGTGTEPGEGAAFAYGLIQALLKRPVKLVVTTHYDLLKTLGFERPDVKNVCLEFDEQNLRPTFRVLDNQPGQSFALAIAERWGIDPAILAQATAVLGQEERMLAGIIGEVERLKREAEQARLLAVSHTAEVERLRQANEQLNRELRQSKQQFMEQTERMKTELEQRIDELLSKTKARLKKTAKQSSRQHEDYVKAASDQAAVVREQKEQAGEVVEEVLQALSILPQEIMTSSEPVKIGDEAAVANSAVRGRVIELNPKRGEAVLEVKGKRMEIPLSKLLKVTFSPPEPDTLLQKLRRSSTSKLKIEESYRSKLEDSSDSVDLHGQTTEEAAESLDLFINRCMLSNISTIRVMHGLGTGRLRAFVQDYLRHNKHVRNVRFAPLSEGGAGVTLADLL